MKRCFPLFAIITLSLSAWYWHHTHTSDDLGKWKPLPDGGEVRVKAITYRDGQTVDIETRTLWQRTLAWMRNPVQPDGSSTLARMTMTHKKHHELLVWLETRNPDLLDWEVDWLMLSTREQTFPVTFAKVVGITGTHRIYQCEHIPYRTARIHLSTMIDGKKLEFDLENPAVREPLPEWTAKRLPQTERIGDLALTLVDVKLVPPEPGGWDKWWEAKPILKLTQRGEEADHLFMNSVTYHDPGGNMSYRCGFFVEPVWRVHVDIFPTVRDPTEFAVEVIGFDFYIAAPERP